MHQRRAFPSKCLLLDRDVLEGGTPGIETVTLSTSSGGAANFATRVIQTFQTFIQKRVIKTALNPDASFRPPALFRQPLLRALPARLIGFGIRKVHLEEK